MEPLKDSYPQHKSKLKTTTPEEQYRRDRISDEWEPNGFTRFAYNKALLESMPVLGGANDQYNGNPDRFKPVSPTMEAEFPVGESGKKKKNTRK